MEWVTLTSEELAKAVKMNLPAILPLGSIEKHGQHLPVGTDGLIVYKWKITLPDGFIGNPTKASKEKGEKLVQAWIDNFAKLTLRIKKLEVDKA